MCIVMFTEVGALIVTQSDNLTTGTLTSRMFDEHCEEVRAGTPHRISTRRTMK